MSEPVSTRTENWIEKNRSKLTRRLGVKTRTNNDMAALAKLLSNKKKSAAMYDDLTQAVIDLNAPASVVSEIKGLQKDVAKHWRKLGPKNEVVLRRYVGDMAKKRGANSIVKRAVQAAAAGDLNVATASDIAIGTTFFAARRKKSKIPWWCYVCYSVPIYGLICLISKRCRGKGKATGISQAIK